MQRLQEAHDKGSLANDVESNSTVVPDLSSTPVKAVVIKEEILEAMDVTFIILTLMCI